LRLRLRLRGQGKGYIPWLVKVEIDNWKIESISVARRSSFHWSKRDSLTGLVTTQKYTCRSWLFSILLPLLLTNRRGKPGVIMTAAYRGFLFSSPEMNTFHQTKGALC
jgi:hypothetical protein